MAPFNYNKLAQRADRIMRRFGRAIEHDVQTFIRRTVGSDVADFEVTALESDFSARERGDGQIIRRDDVRYLVSVIGLSITPNEETDTLILVDTTDSSETELEIVAPPKRTAPGGVNVFWQLHCRER